MKSLDEFLATKELYYKDIDYDFFPTVWERVKKNFRLPKIIHIIGTNGKGSTGRFLAYYLFKSGYKVGHYSSPHIFKFNERIWLDGKDTDDETLQKAYKNLVPKIPQEILKKLSYFEFMTLLAIQTFDECDFVVLEAGLGGEFDATAVFEKLFTIVTPIGIDHESFLGDTIEQIAKTKLNSVKNFAIMTEQKKEVYTVADKLNITYHDASSFFQEQEKKEIKEFIKKNTFASYLSQNLILAMSAVKKLGVKYDIKKLKGVTLKGRFEKITKNITIDVGHNKQASLAIKQELKNKKIVLIYNTYHDKDFYSILSILKQNIKKLLIMKVDNKRIVQKKMLQQALKKLEIEFEDFSIDKLKADEEYLVFGSFVVVEEFLKLYHDPKE